MHETIQEMLRVGFKEGFDVADQTDWKSVFNGIFQKEILKAKEKYKKDGVDIKDILSIDDLEEMYGHCMEIIDYVMIHRRDYFDKNKYDLVGIEVPINVLLSKHEGDSVRFIGFVDVILRDKTKPDHYSIIDLKLSTRKWDTNPAPEKKAQLLLYKKYIAEKYNVSLANINVKYIILKRNVYDPAKAKKKPPSKFVKAEKRIQEINIAQSERTVNKAFKDFMNVVETVIVDSKWNTEHTYMSMPSEHNCRFCPYKGTDLCPEGIT